MLARQPAACDPQPVNLSDLVPESIVRSSTALGWPAVIADYRVLARGGMGARPGNSDHLLALQVRARVDCVQAFDGKRNNTVLAPGDLTLLPAGTPWRWDWSDGNEALDVRLPPAFVDGVAERCGLDPARVRLSPIFRFRDALISQLVGELLDELWQGSSGSPAYVESLATALVVRLLRRCTPTTADARRATQERHGLPPAALDRVLSKIEDELDANLSLLDLADAAGLSAFHFARLFKLSTGCAPHAYVTRRRVERAKRMLVARDAIPLADVAQRCGFYDQSHFIRRFRREVGVTPKQFRAKASAS